MPADETAAQVASRLPLPPRDYLILFALVDGPRHGHGILKLIEAGSAGVLFDPANLYRSLRKLNRDGFVVEAPDHAPVSRPIRRRYRLTKLGRAVLTAEARRLTTLADAARARRLVSASQGIE
jgi:PadR family transcriptional regulator, regulatory protein PadR